MLRSLRILTISILLISRCAASALADEVFLKSGDRVSGEIVRLEKDVLTIKVPFADDRLRINRDAVACIESSGEHTFVFPDGEVVVGKTACSGEGKVLLSSTRLQFSTEVPLPDLQSINPATYRGMFSGGGTLVDGNTDTKALNLSTRFEVKTRRHRFFAEARYTYGETDGETSGRSSTGSLKYDFFSTEKFYTYAQTLVEEDEFADLNLRNTEGIGVGYQFSETPMLSFFIEAGTSHFSEDFAEGTDRQGASARWGVGLEADLVPKRLKLYHRQEGYYNLDPSSFYVRSVQGLRVPVVESLSGHVEAEVRYNSKPEEENNRVDSIIIFGITYEYAYW